MLGAAKRQATHDVLTGLPNRALFSGLVNRQIAIAERVGARFSVLTTTWTGSCPSAISMAMPQAMRFCAK
jgi:predicted signal transduction protein with EAL and GGDEF domain